MALHTKKDFAAICGLKLAELSVNMKRKKVICSGDYIDDADPTNVAFMEKWRAVRNPDVPAPALNGKMRDERKVVAKPDRTVPEKKIPKTKSDRDKFTYNSPQNQLDLKIREIELSRKEEELEISKLKRQKMAGEVIPVDLVLLTFTQYGKATTTAFEDAADNFLVDIHKEAGLTADQMAKMRKNLITIINEAVKESISSAQDAVDNIIAEFSETRGQGERIS